MLAVSQVYPEIQMEPRFKKPMPSIHHDLQSTTASEMVASLPPYSMIHVYVMIVDRYTIQIYRITYIYI